MRRKKRLWTPEALLLTFSILLQGEGHAMLLLTTSCLTGTPSCVCSWKGGKFVSDCSNQNLSQVPKNDYDLSASTASSQMPTLNRDIQQLNLANNNITRLEDDEFMRKKFRNLQKIYLAANRVSYIHAGAFRLLTGLVELDLSENLIASLRFEETPEEAGSRTNKGQEAVEDKTTATPRAGESSSFLWGLANLRVLNLASNQLQRLERLAFSPLLQLRQLHLSRNKISFVDKRAFDGLQLLNVLHLDGNKLSHLDGAILLKLPKLYSIQLGGSNEWRCDCRLRRLARPLLGSNILQDEPRCGVQVEAAEISEPRRSSRDGLVWRDMTADQFECPPQLADSLMGGWTRGWPDELAAGVPAVGAPAARVPAPSSPAPSAPEPAGERVLVRRHYLWAEPVELTSVLALSDELDLAHNQLEWWQLAGAGATLIWRSPTPRPEPAKGEPAVGRFSVIDYVTRANESGAGGWTQVEGQQRAGEPLERQPDDLARSSSARPPADELMGSCGGKLVRVVHLIVNATKEPRPSHRSKHSEEDEEDGELNNRRERTQEADKLFLCRITNRAGRLDILFAISIDSSAVGRTASVGFGRRQAMRKRLAAAQSVAHWLPLGSSSWSLERARAALAEELAAEGSDGPLFIPVHLPEELAQAVSSGLRADGGSLARSLNQDHTNQRTATRQTNSTGAPGLFLPEPAASNRSARSLGLLALDLIGQYTGERQSQPAPDAEEADAAAEEAGIGRPWGSGESVELSAKPDPPGPSQALAPEPLGRLKLLGRLIHARYLDRWTQLAVGEAPLLLGICAGLLAGCLLSMLVVLRLRCANSRVAASNVGSVAAKVAESDADDECEPNEEAEEEEFEEAGALGRPQVSPPGGCEWDKPASGGSGSQCMMPSDASQRRLIGSVDDLRQVHPHLVRPFPYGTLNRQRAGQTRCNNLLMGDCPPEHQFFVMTPQQEMQELRVSPLCQSLAHDARREPSDADSSLVAYQLDNDCQQVVFPVLEQHRHWRAASGANGNASYDEHFTNDDSSSSLLLSNAHSHLQLQPLVVAPPKLRSLDADALLLPYLKSPGEHSPDKGQSRAGDCQHVYCQNSLLLFKPLLRSPADSCQPNSSSSMASPVPSTSSSLMVNGSNQHQYARQDLLLLDSGIDASGEAKPKMYYLDDALQLLNTSAGLCLDRDLLPDKLDK